MPITAGTLSKIQIGTTTASVSATAAVSGSAPYTYQWYRSTTSGFVPAAGNLVSGATSLGLLDSGLVPGTQYYYKVVSIDAIAGSASYAQLGVFTAPVQNQNQFAQTVVLGKVDQLYSYNTLSVEIDSTETGTLLAGQAVKMYDRAGGVPKVVACAANSDEVLGFINYNIKDASYVAGKRCEISMAGNVIYLISVGAIARGAQVQLDLSYAGGVKTITGSSGAKVVGWAMDKATGDGQLIRVHLRTPSFTVA
jgi:hypothetical protein